MAATTQRPFRFAVQAFESSSAGEWLEVARRTEALGYSTLFTADHYFGPGEIASVSGHRPVDVAPIAAMTAAACVTTDLRVGCRVFNVDLHHPVVLAKELATLDLLSDGRVEVGLRAGWLAAEYEGLGIAMHSPSERFGVNESEFAAHPHALLGTVDTICATLEERRERFGLTYVTVPQRNMDDFAPGVARLAGT